VVKENSVICFSLAKHVVYTLKSLSRLALIVLKDGEKNLHSQMPEKEK